MEKKVGRESLESGKGEMPTHRVGGELPVACTSDAGRGCSS